MKIKHISIDGYGKFSGKSLEFAPGLQVVLGPNEQGKSTVRSFVGDMLYGQKRSTTQRAYEESNALRVPWHNPDCYGGALVYELSDGREIEVRRNFDKKRESVQVYDKTHARDITGEFDLMRNRELNFAQTHLALSKDVFLNTATISHFSLEDLGDKDALNAIREKLLSLADSGEESGSADGTLKRLQQRVADIGQKNARTKPLPMARARCVSLQEELQQARAIQQEIEGLMEERQHLLDGLKMLRQERLALEDDLATLDAQEQHERLRQAESLMNRIDSATEHCFALGAVREFPLDQEPTIKIAEETLGQAQTELERLQSELADVTQQSEAEQRHLDSDGVGQAKDIEEEVEQGFVTLSGKVQRHRDRLEETRELIQQAEQRLDEAQERERNLPDYSEVAPDPVEYIRQLASSFSVAQKSRDEEVREFKELQEDVNDRRRAIAANHELFKDKTDFPDMARQYILNKQVFSDKLEQQSNQVQALKTAQEDLSDRMPGYTLLAGGLGLATVGLGATYFLYKPGTGIAIAGTVMLIGFLYFLIMTIRSKTLLGNMKSDVTSLEESLESMGEVDDSVYETVEDMLKQSECESIRELEARYDEYREASAELSVHILSMRSQEEKAQEAEERVDQLLTRFKTTFQDLGEDIKEEQDVEQAARRAIGRYQEYREAKRHVMECRRDLERHEEEAEELRGKLATEEDALHLEEENIRRMLRDFGFEDERRHESTSSALRAFRMRLARHREHRGRLALLGERSQSLTMRIHDAEALVSQKEETLQQLLAQAGVNTVEQWQSKAEQAREYTSVWAKRGDLEEQLSAILQDDDIQSLREACENLGEPTELPDKSREQLKVELAQLSTQIDNQLKEEHALHIAMTERSAGSRSITEIEEALTQAEAQVITLDRELDATAYAMTLIEDIARDKHARIAPKLAERASIYMGRITNGAYTELLINRDMNISVRIPETNMLNENPENTLSKGTVDQVYLALRLALLESICDGNEPAPMLLDDPFANYDDGRLAQTMHLLEEVAQNYQVILFTCREDVGTAAEAIGAPIIRL